MTTIVPPEPSQGLSPSSPPALFSRASLCLLQHPVLPGWIVATRGWWLEMGRALNLPHAMSVQLGASNLTLSDHRSACSIHCCDCFQPSSSVSDTTVGWKRGVYFPSWIAVGAAHGDEELVSCGAGISRGDCSLTAAGAFARGFCSALFHVAFGNKSRLLVLANHLLLPKGLQGHSLPVLPSAKLPP